MEKDLEFRVHNAFFIVSHGGEELSGDLVLHENLIYDRKAFFLSVAVKVQSSDLLHVNASVKSEEVLVILEDIVA